MEGFRESALPPFVISDGNKARLIAIASQENLPLDQVDHVLGVILDSWHQQQREGRTLDEAYSALQLVKDIRERSIAIQDVKLAAKFRQIFLEGSFTSDDFYAALDILPRLREQGIPLLHFSPHCLRHTYASLMLQQGESLTYVQRQLGHASINFTADTYGKWLPPENKAAVDRLDGDF